MEDVKTLPSLLVICKSAVTVLFFQRALEDQYHIIHTSDEYMAKEILKNSTISAVTVEEEAIESAFTFCQHIRAINGYKDIPIFVITNQLKKSHSQKLSQAGASAILFEPLDEMELKQRLSFLKQKMKTKEKTASASSVITDMSSPKESKQRLYLHDQALKELRLMLKEKQSVSLLMIEMDDYINILHQLGELTCEELVLSVSGFLQKQMRKQDILVSLGAAKFVVLLPKTSKTAAQILAENLKEAIEKHPFETAKGSKTITVSIGLVCEDTHNMKEVDSYQSLDRLIGVAKKRLITAKEFGNKIIDQ